jgi:hypothetical protein
MGLGAGVTCIVVSPVRPAYVAVTTASPTPAAVSCPVPLSTEATFGLEDENVEFSG